MEEKIPTETPNIPQRPIGLSILLILSFIGSSALALSHGGWFIMYDMIKNTPALQEMFNVIPHGVETIQRLMSGGKYFFLISFLCALISLTGAILMWNFKRIGFHLYAIAQILLLLMPLLFIGKNAVGIGDVLLASIYIILYASFYKRMGIKL